MSKPTLFVLAAGMGSRYGGLKQLDGLGPHGETIMDYSIYTKTIFLQKWCSNQSTTFQKVLLAQPNAQSLGVLTTL